MFLHIVMHMHDDIICICS